MSDKTRGLKALTKPACGRCCQDISSQVVWYGNNKLSAPEEWKDVQPLDRKRQKVVPGIDGRFRCRSVLAHQKMTVGR